MAAVKTIGGAVVNTAGVALVSKTVTLKNDDTGATITTTTTNGDGEWEFANHDETVRYRAEAAFGGSSSQVVVRKPASAEFDHLYANLSFRTAAGATVALGGSLAVTGNVFITGTLAVTGNISTDGNVSSGGGGYFDSGLGVAGGAFAIDGAGAVSVSQPATFQAGIDIAAGDLHVDGNLTLDGNLTSVLNAPARILVDGGTLPTPEIACISDPDTGLVWNGANQLGLSAGGNEVARAWMNGATSQFASYAAQTLIQNAILIGGAMTTATSVTGVIRKILIQDTSGNFVGWVPVYGAAG